MPVPRERVVLPPVSVRHRDIDEGDLPARVEAGEGQVDVGPVVRLVMIARADVIQAVLPDPADEQPST